MKKPPRRGRGGVRRASSSPVRHRKRWYGPAADTTGPSTRWPEGPRPAIPFAARQPRRRQSTTSSRSSSGLHMDTVTSSNTSRDGSPPGGQDADLRSLLEALRAVRDGDFRPRFVPTTGGTLTEIGEVLAQILDRNRQLRGDLRRAGKAVNRMVDQLSLFTTEVTRVAGELGTEGWLGGRSRARGLTGGWARASEAVNDMAARLTAQVRDIALVTTAIAKGDLTRKVTAEATGEMLELKVTVNTMVDQLSAFAGEVTRVAREVGTEGVLGGQARVPGAEGVWKDLTDHVNLLAANLTTQVRAIAEVAGAVAHGDLTRAISVDVSGEVAELKDNVNLMVANLRETTRAKDWLE